MPTEIVFSGTDSVVVGTDVFGLIQNLTRVDRAEKIIVQGRELPRGYVDVETDDGVIYVNPRQVAYVREVEARPRGAIAGTTTRGVSPSYGGSNFG